MEGDIVSIDTGCKLNGWCGDAAATYAVGRIHPEVRRLLDVTRNVLDLAIRLMGKCTRWSQVAFEMEAYVKKNRFSVVEAFVGHGIGREMHEDPQVPNFVSSQLRRGGDFRLGARAGDCHRADGEHGHKAGADASRPLDPGHRRWPCQRPF